MITTVIFTNGISFASFMKHFKEARILPVFIFFLFVSVNGLRAENKSLKLNYQSLNRQAQKEYLHPVHSGNTHQYPFWNEYSTKFIYTPAFSFQPIIGAEKYLFTIKQNGKVYTFKADSPQADLSPIWNKLAVGHAELTVQGLSNDGSILGEAGQRKFLRDFPFAGPYDEYQGSYRDVAVKGALYFHNIPGIQHWKESDIPNMTHYSLNSFACKIYSATIRNECFLAREVPALHDEALQIARNVAQCLMKIAQTPDKPLAYFPPTYYRNPGDDNNYRGVLDSNKQYTMFLEAADVATAFLELYDATKDRKYVDFALHIADTYQKNQATDGSWPVKVNFETGKPITDSKSLPTNVLRFIRRLKTDFGVNKYDDMVKKSEEWCMANILTDFNFNGMFEDCNIMGVKPYQDLTGYFASSYADYLLTKQKPSEKEIRLAEEIMRFCEDQFVVWDYLPDKNGFKKYQTPTAFEQYVFYVSVDASAARDACSFLSLYKTTGDKLWYAKAKALADNLVRTQNPANGHIPTVLNYSSNNYLNGNDAEVGSWINCTYMDIIALMRMEQFRNKHSK